MSQSELPTSVFCAKKEIGYAVVNVHRLSDGRLVVPEDDIVGIMFGEKDDYGPLPDMIRGIAPEYVEFWYGDNIVVGYEAHTMSCLMLQFFSDARIECMVSGNAAAEETATKVGHVLYAIVAAALNQLLVDGLLASIRDSVH